MEGNTELIQKNIAIEVDIFKDSLDNPCLHPLWEKVSKGNFPEVEKRSRQELIEFAGILELLAQAAKDEIADGQFQ